MLSRRDALPGRLYHFEMETRTLGVIINQFISNAIKRIRRAGTIAFAEFAVMPNDIHGIVIIVGIDNSPVETLPATSLPSSTMSSISPRNSCST
jgi:RNase P protein component